MAAAALPTFDEVLASTKADARKNDLKNLAHVHVELNRHKLKLAADMAKVDETIAEVEAVGSKTDATQEEVAKVYDKARRLYQGR
jgi:sorbitol-specific phosphotransferase system component IIA